MTDEEFLARLTQGQAHCLRQIGGFALHRAADHPAVAHALHRQRLDDEARITGEHALHLRQLPRGSRHLAAQQRPRRRSAVLPHRHELFAPRAAVGTDHQPAGQALSGHGDLLSAKVG